MGNRMLRVNELLKREVSAYIHSQLRSEAVGVTVIAVEATSDFKSAVAYFSVVADLASPQKMENLLNARAQEVNQHLRRVITLRNIPRVRFRHDQAMERGNRILQIIDELETERKSREP